MSIRYNGSFIGIKRSPTVTSAKGVWNLDTQRYAVALDQWPVVSALPVGGAKIWLDSTDGDTLFDATSGGSSVAYDGLIARWENKIKGGGDFTQSNSDLRPIRKESVVGSLGSVVFNNDFMEFSGTLSLTSGFSTYFVQKRVSNNGGSLLGWDAGIGDHTPYSGPGWYYSFGRTDRPGWSGPPQYTTEPVLLSCLASPSTWTAYLNGIQRYTDSATLADNGSRPYIGKGSIPANSHLAELIIYEETHDNDQRNLVENYLMTKWGIS